LAPRDLVALSSQHAPPPWIHTLSLHDALPISDEDDDSLVPQVHHLGPEQGTPGLRRQLHDELPCEKFSEGLPRLAVTVEAQLDKSEEHTSELQSRENLVCRLLLEKKKNAEDMP